MGAETANDMGGARGVSPRGSQYTVINPATEQPVTTIPQTGAEQADEAIARRRRAQESWRAVAPGDRARLLRAFAAAVDANLDDLAALEIAGSGHPAGQARWEAGPRPGRAARITPPPRSG